MNDGELAKETKNNNDDSWESVKEIPFPTAQEKTWADEVEDKKEGLKEAIDSYRAASEAFRSDFNERATGPEQFAQWVASGEEGITKEEIEFEGKKITVYHLVGHEFLDLVHCIDYRGAKAYERSYPEIYQKSKAIRENPSNWGIKPSENNPKNTNTGATKTQSANNISASLASDKVPNGHWIDNPKAIYYGFSNIGHRGVITAGNHDMHTQQGWTSNINTEDFHKVSSTGTTPEWADSGIGKADFPRAIPTLESMEEKDSANEVAIDRYEEDNGQPLLPDFIFCPELPTGSVSELADDQKRHAAYFGVPIVILHRDDYE